MGINYLEGVEAGQRIDVSAYSRFDKNKKVGSEPRPEDYLSSLKEQMRQLALEKNKILAGFLELDGCIALNGPEAESDKRLVEEQERGFALSSGKSVEEWRLASEKNRANLTEMALTLLIHKKLGPDFIVARASKYDDYNNGIDYVIIHIPSGETVCGLDAVIGNQGDDGGLKKEDKIRRIMDKGGARLRYGAKIKDGQLVRAAIDKLPVFSMSLSKEELASLQSDLKNKPEEITPGEEKIFNKLLNSLSDQADDNKDLSQKNQEMLRKIESVLEKLRQPARKLAA